MCLVGLSDNILIGSAYTIYYTIKEKVLLNPNPTSGPDNGGEGDYGGYLEMETNWPNDERDAKIIVQAAVTGRDLIDITLKLRGGGPRSSRKKNVKINLQKVVL
jgi:hypothetical protein